MFPKNARLDVKMGDKAARGPPPAFNAVQNSFAQIHFIILTEKKHIFPKNAQRDVKMGDKAARRSPPACFSIFSLSLPCKKIHIYMNFFY